MLLSILLLVAVSLTCGTDVNYYLNVRWDNVSNMVADPQHIPYNHGLRYVPAFYVALKKIKNMNITVPPGNVKSFFERSGKIRAKGKNSRKLGDYYIGTCAKDSYGYTCYNKDIFNLRRNRSLLTADENINFIYPNITGNEDTLGVTETLNGLITAMGGMNISGILGSTDAARLAAEYAKYYEVPNFVTHVTGAQETWPLDNEKNVEDRLLDNSPVFGYEPFVIADLFVVHYSIVSPLGYWNGKMQIIHEGGYNRLLSKQFVDEFPKRFVRLIPNAENSVIADGIRRTETNFYTFGQDEEERDGTKSQMTDSTWNSTILDVQNHGRLILLMGKRALFRDFLLRFVDLGLNDKDYVFYFIPENGAPCPSFWESQGNENNARDAELKEIMEGNFLLCHNGHNREWVNGLIKLKPSDTASYGTPRCISELKMTKWNNFEQEFRQEALARFNYNVPADEDISALAGFAHDSLIWAAFTNWFRKKKPHWFEGLDRDKRFTMRGLFSGSKDGSSSNGKDLVQPMGWKGMFGGDADNMIMGCCGNFLYNQFCWTNLRQAHDSLQVKQMKNGDWKPLLSYKYKRGSYPLDMMVAQPDDNTKNSPPYKDIREPSDGCGYGGQLCAAQRRTEKILWIAAAVLFVMCVLVIPGLIFARRHYMYQKAVGDMNWRLDASTIGFEGPGLGFASTQGAGTNVGTMMTAMMSNIDVGTAPGTKCTTGARSKRMSIFGLSKGTRMTNQDTMNKKDQIFVARAVYKTKKCAMQELRPEYEKLFTERPLMKIMVEMKELKDMQHDNIVTFHGMCMSEEIGLPVKLTDYCTRGSLSDLLENEDFVLDFDFSLSFISDLIKGMAYIHSSKNISSHGYLKSSNCLITTHFGLKISDFGTIVRTNDIQRVGEMENQAIHNRMLWTAPELLRLPFDQVPPKGTKPGDVYSCGIIVHEILQRKGPYGSMSDDCFLGRDEMIDWIKHVQILGREPFRPHFEIYDKPESMVVVGLAKQCWNEVPEARPTFKHLEQKITKLQSGGKSLIERVIEKMERFVADMEKLKSTYDKEKATNAARFDLIQKELLPQKQITSMKMGKMSAPEQYDCVSVLSLEIINDCTEGDDDDIWNMLDTVYKFIEDQCNVRSFYTVKRSVNKFLIVANAVHPVSNHAEECCAFVNKLRDFIQAHNTLTLKAGMASGAVVGTVVPGNYSRFTVYGQPCETAVALRKTAKEGQLLVSQRSRDLIGEHSKMILKKCLALPTPTPGLQEEVVYNVYCRSESSLHHS